MISWIFDIRFYLVFSNRGTIQTSTLRKEKRVTEVIKAYKNLELLSSRYNESLGSYFLARFNSATALSIIASAFLFVKLFSLNDIFISGLSFVCSTVLLTTFTTLTIFCSTVQVDSHRLHRTLLATKTTSKTLARDFNRFRIIGVKCGNFFLVKRGTLLTMLAMISNATMSLLVSIHFSI